MIFRAGYLCEMWKNSAMDTAVFPSEDEDWAWAGLRGDQPDNAVSIGKAEIRPLSQEEQEAVFRCVTLMLKSGSLEDSLNNVLQRIGKFYRAARTYLLTLSEDRQTVVMRGEWMESGRQSIRYILSGVGISQIPVLEKCLREKNTVFIESPMNRLTRAVRDEGKWNFMVFPLTRKSEITSFFCIENAREHQSETLVLRTLQPYITGEQNRFEMLAARMNAANHDALPLLPNLTSYMEVVCSLDSDAYSSMGALSVDVPNFQALTGSFGFEYGRKMLMFISDTLTGIFGKAFIFRTWDAEFVVLFPDTIREVFNGRCNRLRTVLQRRYPHQIRIGSVWSGGVFEARNLVREAQMVMRSDDVETRERTVDQENAKYQMISREFSVKKFIPYFQPKVDMRDGSVTGAEALVRGVDSDGNTISPGVFIEAMERDGTIRELDLFMLDAVFQQLSEWKEKGDRVLPVSVNMSRVTLFNPTTLASVLAIQSRYPELEEGLVELEITETGSDMEKATLADIVNNFRECGMQFELDDFGSGYANISLFSNIRFHTIKLDRSLVNDLPENEISSMLVENITQICRNFGMNCIAEGVETRQQAEELMKAGCNYAQGFYYAKPLPADEFRKRYLEPNVAAQV